ncbi:energy transducer TonB [Reinekea thalattae]|uniref:Protein TonB n=1 Tax=Reinekea thalattae TaxID=2593301 RepID=A0A5C8Z4L5_9GAMM|nr:energy transducer TonB [Reinekea thalattae]TXR52138.1 energy transducer TonB [Reinekea thalattae]
MTRFLLAVPLSLMAAFSIFSFMAWLVNEDHYAVVETQPPLRFDMLMIEQESDTQRRKRAAPEPPTPLTPPPPQSLASAAAPSLNTSSALDLPEFDFDMSVGDLAITPPSFADLGGSQELVPLYRVPPQYPPAAQRQNLEGYVELSFTIDPEGKVRDIKVLNAEPRNVFDRDAIRALRRWKYQAKIVDGVAVAQTGQRIKLEFSLE